MADARTNQKIKQLVMQALRKAKPQFQNATIDAPGLFATREQLDLIPPARKLLDQVKGGAKNTPTALDDLERMVDYEIAFMHFPLMVGLLVIDMAAGDKRSMNQHLKEARDDIAAMRRVGNESMAQQSEATLQDTLEGR